MDTQATILNIGSNVRQLSALNLKNSKNLEDFQKTFANILNSRKGLNSLKGLNFSEAKVNKTSSGSAFNKEPAIDTDEKERNIDEVDEKNAIVKTIADILNMNANDIIKILKISGNVYFNQESAIDSEKVVNDISDLLSLNSEQKNLLTKLIGLAANKSTAPTLTKDKLQAQYAGNAFGDFGKVNEQHSNQDIDSSTLSSANEADVDDTGKLLKDEPNALLAEVKVKIEALLANNKAQTIVKTDSSLEKEVSLAVNSDNLAVKEDKLLKAEVLQSNESMNTDDVELISNVESQKESEKADGKYDADYPEDNIQESSKTGQTEQLTELSVDSRELFQPSDNNSQVVSDINPQMQAVQSSVSHQQNDFSKISGSSIRTMDPYSNEILSQIVEKASVTLDEGKSEMVMNLKPDNLGKLELKVVTERGIVVASFLAESQQVKEIIESNMQLLKDALEKQGLNVQSFSVSVRQDSDQELNKNNNAAYSKQGLLGKRLNYRNTSSISLASSITEKLNPYRNEDSIINYIV